MSGCCTVAPLSADAGAGELGGLPRCLERDGQGLAPGAAELALMILRREGGAGHDGLAVELAGDNEGELAGPAVALRHGTGGDEAGSDRSAVSVKASEGAVPRDRRAVGHRR